MIIGFKQKSVYYIGLVLVTFGCLTAAESAQAQSGPKLTIRTQEFDFGQVPGHCTLEFSSWIHSVGTEELILGEIKSGCACVSNYLGRNKLAPGDSSEIRLKWTIRDSTGMQSREIYLFSNAGDGVDKIKLSAEIAGADLPVPVTIYPERISLPEMAKNRKQPLRLTSKLDIGCRLKSVLIGSGIASLDLPDSLKSGQTGQIRLEIEPEAMNQRLETSVTIEVSNGSGPGYRITVPVTVGDFSFKPMNIRTLREN